MSSIAAWGTPNITETAVMHGRSFCVKKLMKLLCCSGLVEEVATTNSDDCSLENAVSSLKSPVVSYRSKATWTSCARRSTYRFSSDGTDNGSKASGREPTSSRTLSRRSFEYTFTLSPSSRFAIRNAISHSLLNPTAPCGIGILGSLFLSRWKISPTAHQRSHMHLAAEPASLSPLAAAADNASLTSAIAADKSPNLNTSLSLVAPSPRKNFSRYAAEFMATSITLPLR